MKMLSCTQSSWHWAKFHESRLPCHKALWYESVRIMHVGNNFCGGRVGAAAAREYMSSGKYPLSLSLASIEHSLAASQPAAQRVHEPEAVWLKQSSIFPHSPESHTRKKALSLSTCSVFGVCVYILMQKTARRDGCWKILHSTVHWNSAPGRIIVARLYCESEWHF